MARSIAGIKKRTFFKKTSVNKKAHFNPSRASKKPGKSKTENVNTKLIMLNKPFDVLTQFSDDLGRKTLADFVSVKSVYPAGRLDRDSEGLVLLTNDGQLQARIADPKYGLAKTYWAQVEGIATKEQLAQLASGVQLKDGLTLPATACAINAPNVWERTPPVRYRASIPTSWIELTIIEGKNRQVRRMTAAVGLPTLRLIRVRIGPWQLEGLGSGHWKEIDAAPLKTYLPANRR